jgi:hypothetical protein
MTPSRVVLRFLDTIRWMSKDLDFEEHYEGIYGSFWPTPQSKMIIPRLLRKGLESIRKSSRWNKLLGI